MERVDIRPGMVMAYADDWFGEPWTAPQTVVMVHGNAESSRAWTCFVPHLARKFRVVRPDLPGFGASSAPADYGWSAPELAGDLARFLDALKVSTCHLVGAKYGGSYLAARVIEREHFPRHDRPSPAPQKKTGVPRTRDGTVHPSIATDRIAAHRAHVRFRGKRTRNAQSEFFRVWPTFRFPRR